MDDPLFVSIIIPCKSIDNDAKNCVEQCKNLDYKRNYYEIIILPDDPSEHIEGVVVIPTGPVTPGTKRNIGITHSVGEICAFIDSDAYPRNDWLKNAEKYFYNSEVAAVGGPGLTPPENSSMQKAGGLILSSFMMGNLSKRYKRSKQVTECNETHSCNFLVRKSILMKIDRWNDKYWPGEDTLICGAIKKIGKKILDASDVIVYHNRRPLFRSHLSQVYNYGLHRGFFIKKFQTISGNLTYFGPSLMIIVFFALGLASLVSDSAKILALSMTIIYLFTCLFASIFASRNPRIIARVWIGIIMTHLTYGISFIIGIAINDVRR